MKKILLSFIVAAFVLLSAEQASACVCVLLENPTSEEVKARFTHELKEASVVFSGEVTHLDKFKVKFKVEKVWKGDTAEEITMLTGTKDNDDGTITISSCDYRFELGEKYVVYARGSGEKLRTYQCTGTGRMKDSEQRIKFIEETSPDTEES